MAAMLLLVVSSLIRFFFFFTTVLESAAVGSARPGGQFQPLCANDLKPQAPPRVLCDGDGGTVELWEGDSLFALKTANVVVARITLRPGGLLMPSYLDIPTLSVVVRGALRVGINNPWMDRAMETAYKITEGDVIALPQAVANWWFNDGQEDAVIFCVVSLDSESEKVFLLAGGKGNSTDRNDFGSVLKGFSTKFIAQMWDVSEDMVRSIVNSQQGRGLIRVSKGMDIPVPDVSIEATTGLNMDFIYHHADAYPDLKVEQAGELRELNSLKMPILQTLGMSAECVKLLEDAMVAPSWYHNGHQIIYVQSGSGRLQVVNNLGDRILDVEVQQGSLVVIPRFFPSTKIAGEKGMQYVSIVTTDRPIMSFLGGYNSIYSGFPVEILSSTFNIDQEMAKKLQQGRSKKGIIIPPKQPRSC